MLNESKKMLESGKVYTGFTPNIIIPDISEVLIFFNISLTFLVSPLRIKEIFVELLASLRIRSLIEFVKI